MEDPEIVRTRTCHGWAFRDLGPEELNRVKAYLIDGDPRHLEGTSYLKLRAGVLERLTPKERRTLKVPDPELERGPSEAVKPDPAVVASLDQALADPNADVHIFDQDDKLLLAVDKNNKVVFRLNCDPVEAMAILHGLFHVLEDVVKKADGDLS